MENIYDRIRKVYDESGLTRAEFANSLGRDASYISKIVKGTYQGNVSEGLLKLIAAVYNVDIDWLQSGKGDMHVKEERALYMDDLDRAILEAIRDEGRDFKSEILRIVRKEKVLAELMRQQPEGMGK